MNKGLFVKTLAVVLLVCVVLCCTLVVVVDPFFHFHKPILALSYPLVNERYQNDVTLFDTLYESYCRFWNSRHKSCVRTIITG